MKRIATATNATATMKARATTPPIIVAVSVVELVVGGAVAGKWRASVHFIYSYNGSSCD